MAKKTRIQQTAGVMFTVALIASASLAIVYQLTKEPIKETQNKRVADSIKEVMPAGFDNDPFAEKIVIKHNKTRYTLYPARKEGYVTSIAMKSSSNKGFGGRMDVIVGFLIDGTISGYNVIKHKETPGLGAKVNDPKFKQNIIGRKPSEETFKVRQDGGEVDAITGATISSRALIDAIKKAYRGYVNFNTGNNDE